MSEIKKVQCPHCKEMVSLEKNSTGKWIGTIVGGGIGYVLTAGIGIAGVIFGISFAISAVFIGIGVGALIGNRVGAMIDNTNAKCPNCGKKISI